MVTSLKLKNLNPFRKKAALETLDEVLLSDAHPKGPLDTESFLPEVRHDPSPGSVSSASSTFYDGTVYSNHPLSSSHTAAAPRGSSQFPLLLRSARLERLKVYKRGIRIGLRIIIQPLMSFTPFASKAVEPFPRPPSPHPRKVKKPRRPTSRLPGPTIRDNIDSNTPSAPQSPTFDPEMHYPSIPSVHTTSLPPLSDPHSSTPASPHHVQISPTPSQSSMPSIPSAPSSRRRVPIDRRRDPRVHNRQVRHFRSVPVFPPGLGSEENYSLAHPFRFEALSTTSRDGEGQTNRVHSMPTDAPGRTSTGAGPRSLSSYYDIDALASIPSDSPRYLPVSSPWLDEMEISVSPASSVPDLRFIPEIQAESRDSSLGSRVSSPTHASSQRQPIFVPLPLSCSAGFTDGVWSEDGVEAI